MFAMVMPTETIATTVPSTKTGTTEAHRGAERPGVLLGEDPALRRGAQVADELLPDLRRVGVGEAGAVERHDDDEVDVGVAADVSANGCNAADGSASSTRCTVGESATDWATETARSIAVARASRRAS